MKFLLDMPVSPLLLDVLEAFGHEGVHAFQIGESRAADIKLLELARNENRVIITADLDFPRLLALSGSDGPGVVLFRGGNYSDAEMCELLKRLLNEAAPNVISSSISVVDKRRIRITKLPLK